MQIGILLVLQRPSLSIAQASQLKKIKVPLTPLPCHSGIFPTADSSRAAAPSPAPASVLVAAFSLLFIQYNNE
jgi:hypothetical protein